MGDIINDTTPEKKKSWKSKPRRSLCLPSSDEWNRYRDAFDMPDQPNQKSSWTKKQIRKRALVSNNTLQTGENHSQLDIADYSSSDEEGFDDIKPLTSTSPPPKQRLPSHRKVLAQRSGQKKKSKKRRSDFFEVGSDCEVDITESSPLRPAKVMRPSDKGERIDSESPADKRKSRPPTPPQSSSSTSQDVTISDYESQTKSAESLPSVKSCDAVSCDSPVISSAGTPPEGPAKAAKVRSSEWLQNLQWTATSHTKQSEDDGEGALEDSAKKKKQKYCKGGMADRLHQITRRKQSTQNVWNHRQSTAQQAASDLIKSLVVELLQTKVEFSTLVTKCRRCRATSDGSPESEKEQEPLTVLFSLETAKRLSLKTKSIVQIHPPWQSLQSSGRENVVLCTHFCRLLNGHDDVSNDDTPSPAREADDVTEPVAETVAKWSCPCQRDGTFPRRSCPAQTTPCDTSPLLHQPSEVVPVTGASPVGSPHPHLRTEILSQSSSQACRGILESIENQGGFGACGISLQATVQRVFYKRITTSSERGISQAGTASCPPAVGMRVSVLLQDRTGTCCEVALPARCEGSEGWRSLCEGGEGKIWSFSGLRQHCRTNKNRDPCLFQLIESVYPVEGIAVSAASSQSDSQQSQSRPVSRTAQAFCYRLVAPSGESSCRTVGPGPMYQPSTYCRLRDVSGPTQLRPRVTLTCRVIFTHPQVVTDGKSCRYWYVVDDSTATGPTTSSCSDHGYRKVTIQPACWLSPAMCTELKSARPAVLLKDVAVENGQYFCDGFSRVYPASLLENIRHQLLLPCDPPTTSSLRSSASLIGDLGKVTCVTVDDLVTVSGQVSGVNEETAVVWEACDNCGSADLESSPTHMDTRHCIKCNKPVLTPVTRVHLEVHVCLQVALQSAPIQLKVNLLQTSIERLLPAECDEEGYDIQSVLGKPLGPHVSQMRPSPVNLYMLSETVY